MKDRLILSRINILYVYTNIILYTNIKIYTKYHVVYWMTE